MKISVCQMIAIVCILAVGFVTVPPLVQTADAHDYTVTVDILQIGICSCGTIGVRLFEDQTVTITHADGESHISEGSTLIHVVSFTCSSCSSSSS